ncbi:MAG TPA: biotin--[acetyl-CoA-carboxylase] ligase [Bacteroidia bacterium]|jgi:BirA family biotin operon repressor/biotin-[acetyl-CoA-carboxylase] ligase
MNTLFTGRKIIELDRVASTNSYAMELLRGFDLPEGTVVRAREQFSGRGQRGNGWESEPGKNITASFIFRPSFIGAAQQFMMSKAVALAVSDLVLNYIKSVPVRIKWPNDIYCGNKKIAGLLIENILQQQSITACVAGIGLNVNQEIFTHSVNPTSFKLLVDKEVAPEEVFEKLCESLEARYLELRAGKCRELDRDYLHRLYRYMEWSEFTIGNKTVKAKISGISQSGKLKVEIENEREKEFDLKEIQMVI